jgi:D-methionine transport system ATP-binding protein
LILDLQHVSLAILRGTGYLLQEVSFDVERGERLAVIGASGAGKTTLLRLLNRLEDPTSGEIVFEGRSIHQIPVSQLRTEIVLIPQEPKLLGMTVQESLAYPLQLQKRPRGEILDRLETWTSLLQIPTEWFERTELQLSLGQRQLVSIARGLILQPKILLLDEPTSALDVGTATRLLTVLGDRSEMTIMMVNHQLELVKTFAKRLIYLQQGRVLDIQETAGVDWQALRDRLIRSRGQNGDEDWED